MYTLYKGATRPPMILGVPTEPLIYAFMIISIAAIATTMAVYVFAPIIFVVMRMIAKRDDRAFRQWGLFIDTKLRCQKVVKDFFGATSYTPIKMRNEYFKK